MIPVVVKALGMTKKKAENQSSEFQETLVCKNWKR